MTTETEIHQKTIDRLCIRDDLSREELLKLSAARKAIAPTIEREWITEGRWTIELAHQLAHEIHGAENWGAQIYRTGSGAYDGLRTVYPHEERHNPNWKGYADRKIALKDAKAWIAKIEGP